MKVLFFAQGRQLAACEQGELEFTGPITQDEFWMQLLAAFPALGPLRQGSRLARAEAYLDSREVLFPDDEIAVIPPVSGG